MLNTHAKLNPHVLDKNVEQVPIRKGFGEGLLQAGEENENVVGLCADLTESTYMSLFRDKFPERFIEIGVAEQNLATVGSGMAAMGKIPFITSYAMFSPGRNWEQIRTTICYNDRPVKIAGSHAGISVGPDGGTHQALEDIALMRVIPRMIVLSPCDSIEARKATLLAARIDAPVYIRLAREKTPVITTEKTPFEIGQAQIFFKPHVGIVPAVTIIATGSLVHRALRAARMLESKGVASTVLNVATIKPLDEGTILEQVGISGAVVTVEEHQVIGGLGSAIAELLSERLPRPIEFVAVRGEFGQSGKPEELLKHYRLDEDAIRDAALRVIERKG